jgi:hypothetical protein
MQMCVNIINQSRKSLINKSEIIAILNIENKIRDLLLLSVADISCVLMSLNIIKDRVTPYVIHHFLYNHLFDVFSYFSFLLP